jgi:hypothetical protein
MILIFLSFSSTVFGQTLEELKNRNKTLETDLGIATEVIEDLTYKIKELELHSKSISDITAIVTRPITPARNYNKEYEEQLSLNNTLNAQKKALKKKQSELNAEIARLKKLLAIEIQKVKELEYEKQQLETTIAGMEVEIDGLELANGILTNDKRKLERNVRQLQIDSTQKEIVIANQQHTIGVKETIITRKEERIDKLEGKNKAQALTINQQGAKIQFLHNENAVKKLHLQTIYLGTSYRVSNIFNPYDKSPNLVRDYQSNINFSLYAAPLGLYFSLPLSYKDRVPSFEDAEIHYYTIQDIESVKMQLDIKGGLYTNIQYSSTELNFSSYNLGFYWSPMKFTYLMFGATRINGATWDLYTGDFSQTDKFGIPSLVKTTDDYYVVNYTDLSIIKPVVGVAGVFPLRLRKDSRNPNGKIKSIYVNKYNYNVGLQVELGYNWAYENYFLNTGLHIKLANIDGESKTVRVGIKRAKKQIKNAKRDYNVGLLDSIESHKLITTGRALIDTSSMKPCIKRNDLCRGRDRVLLGEKSKIGALKKIIDAQEDEIEGKSTIGKLLIQESVLLRIGEAEDYEEKENKGNLLLEEVKKLRKELETLKKQLENLENNPTVYEESECYKKGLFGKKIRKRCNDFNKESDEK